MRLEFSFRDNQVGTHGVRINFASFKIRALKLYAGLILDIFSAIRLCYLFIELFNKFFIICF